MYVRVHIYIYIPVYIDIEDVCSVEKERRTTLPNVNPGLINPYAVEFEGCKLYKSITE